MVQEAYHAGNTNAPQWPSQYCWPEGFMRRWHEFAVWEWHIVAAPSVFQIVTGVARNFITTAHIGREFKMEGSAPRLGQDVPRWYGETIGFWDGDTLITWTSNIQGWKVHSAFEYSNKMQTIEVYTPNRDSAGKFLGFNHEAIFYDPEALVEPVRIIRNHVKTSGFEEGDPYVFIDCVQTIFPIEGRSYARRRRARSFNTKFPICTAAPGPIIGRSTSSRGWRSPRARISSASIKLFRYTVLAT